MILFKLACCFAFEMSFPVSTFPTDTATSMHTHSDAQCTYQVKTYFDGRYYVTIHEFGHADNCACFVDECKRVCKDLSDGRYTRRVYVTEHGPNCKCF